MVEYLLGTERGRRFAPTLTDSEADLHVPALCDVEVVSGLRGLLLRRSVSAARAQHALEDYLDLPLTRHGHLALVHRVFDLRENFSSYDASYVALAEGLGATLLSGDGALLRAVRAHTEVEALPDN